MVERQPGPPRVRYRFPLRWSREAVLAALLEWVSEEGRPPRSYDWDPATAKGQGLVPPASTRCELLLPRPKANPDGEHPLSVSMLRGRLAAWLADCEIRDATGRPVHVTPHQFRHTLGTRLINNEVPLHTVQRLFDHASPEMTARYATIKDETLRREWERYQERINVRGEVIRLDPEGPLSYAAWAKENLARAKQTLPNGYCGLPLQQQCPHPNACLTCDHFLTTEEFMPIHIEQLKRTTELIATAEAEGKERLVEMNEPVRLSLVRIIEGLESLGDGEAEDQESSDAA